MGHDPRTTHAEEGPSTWGAVADLGLRRVAPAFAPAALLHITITLPALSALAVGYFLMPSGEFATGRLEDVVPCLWLWGGATTVALLLQALIEPVARAAFYRWADERAKGRTTSVFEALTEVRQRLGAVSAVGCAYGGALFAFGMGVLAALVGVGAVGFVAASGRGAQALVLFGGASALGIIAALAGIRFALRYGFALAAIGAAREANTGWREVFGSSAAKMHGDYGLAVRVLAFLWVLRLGLVMLGMFVFAPPGGSLDVMEPEIATVVNGVPDFLRRQTMQQGVGFVMAALFAPFAASCWHVLYLRAGGPSTQSGDAST